MDHADSIPAEDVLLEHAGFLTRLARGLLRDEHAAEDVVQDAFVRAMERPPGPGNVGGWLARVTRNLALSRLRSESRRRRRESAVARPEGLPSADDAVARVELQRRAVEAVLALPEPYRSTLVYRYLNGLSVDDIARRGDLPRETVRTRLRRALEKVRSRLDADHGGDRRAWSVLLLPLLAPRSAAAGLVIGGALIVKKAAVVLAVLLVVATGLTLYSHLAHRADGPTPPAAPGPEHTAGGPESAPADPAPEVPAPVDFARVDRDRDVFGVVVDEEGNPVAGASVESLRRPYRRFAALIPGSLETVPGPRATTAADGSFSLRFERGQTADLVVRADGYAPLVRHDCPAGGRLRLVLAKGRALAIRVETADGRPVAGAHVEFPGGFFGGRLYESASGIFLPSAGVADSGGILALGAGAPDAGLPLLAWREDLGVAWVEKVEFPAEGTAVVVLPGGEEIAGVVVDSETGEAVAGATIAWLPVPFGPRIVTAEDGRFVWSGWHGGLNGSGLVFVTAEGYALSPVAMGERIEISRGGGVEGRLVSPVGEPVAGARVAAIGRSHGMPDLAEEVTGPDGAFSLGGLDPAYGHSLIFVAPGFGRTAFDLDPIPLGEVKRLGDLVLPVGRRIEGRLFDAAGAPRPDVVVTLTGANADRGRFRTESGSPERTPGARETARTDDLGRFRFLDLAPGEYELAPFGSGQSPLAKTVTLPAGADRLDVVLRPEGAGDFTVVVTDEHMDPVVGALVGVYWQVGKQYAKQGGRTDAAGRARFRVPAGDAEVQVSVRPPEGRTMLSATTRARADLGECRVTLERAAAVTGTVFGTDGEPLAFAVVQARWSEGGSTPVATDAEGRFSLLAPADSRVELNLTGQVGKGREPIAGSATVAAGREDVVIRAVRIDTDRTLRIRVLSPDGEPVAGIRLNFVGPDHQYLRTDDDGCATAQNLPARETTVMVFPVHDHPAFGRWAEPERVTVVPAGQEVVLSFREGRPIAGEVLDPDGAPAHALVVAADREGGYLSQTATDEAGRFTLMLPRDVGGGVTLEVHAAARPGAPGKPFVSEFKDARLEDVALGTTDLSITLERR